MEYIATFAFAVCSNTKELAKLKCGAFIKEMIDRFYQKINSTLKPNRSLWLYSAHDFTISNLLNSLGLFEKVIFSYRKKTLRIYSIEFSLLIILEQLHVPPTGSSLHFELYESKDNEHFIQIFYRKSNEDSPMPMNIPGYGEKCTLNQFYDLCKEIIPDDHLECQLN